MKTRTMNHESKKAFSLIELIVYFTIFGVIAGIGGSVLLYTLNARGVVEQMSQVHSTTERVLQQIVNRVQVADSIIGASSTLDLEMASSSINPTIFSLASGAVDIKEGANPVASTTSNQVIVTNLSFQLLTNPAPSTSTVQISITAGYNDNGTLKSGSEYTLQTTAMPLR